MKKLIKKLLKINKFIYLLTAVLVFISVIFLFSINYYDKSKDQKKLSNSQITNKSISVKKYNRIDKDEKKLIIEKYIEQKKRNKDLSSKGSSKSQSETAINLKSKKVPIVHNSFVIIIDDAGMNIEKLNRLLNLKVNNLTLAFLPYSNNLNYQVKLARNFGHDILVHIPMEPENIFVDPGPNALLTSHSKGELKSKIEWNLSRFDHFVGVNNHMGSKFTSDLRSIQNFFEIIKSEDIIFVDSKTTNNSLAADIAIKFDIPTLERDIFLDNEHNKKYVIMQLNKAEKIAKSKGYVVVIGHLQDWTIDALEEWHLEANKRGLNFETVSSIIKKKLVN